MTFQKHPTAGRFPGPWPRRPGWGAGPAEGDPPGGSQPHAGPGAQARCGLPQPTREASVASSATVCLDGAPPTEVWALVPEVNLRALKQREFVKLIFRTGGVRWSPPGCAVPSWKRLAVALPLCLGGAGRRGAARDANVFVSLELNCTIKCEL